VSESESFCSTHLGPERLIGEGDEDEPAGLERPSEVCKECLGILEVLNGAAAHDRVERLVLERQRGHGGRRVGVEVPNKPPVEYGIPRQLLGVHTVPDERIASVEDDAFRHVRAIRRRQVEDRDALAGLERAEVLFVDGPLRANELVVGMVAEAGERVEVTVWTGV